MKKILTITMIFLSGVSALTTWTGLAYENRLADSLFQHDLIPVLGAFATFIIACVFWMSLFKRYPQMEEKRKHIFNLAFIPVVCIFIFFASTMYSIIGIGGAGCNIFSRKMDYSIDLSKNSLR